MIILKDIRGRNFYLYKDTAKDVHFVATRQSMHDAIALATKPHFNIKLRIYARPGIAHAACATSTDVAVFLTNRKGFWLQMGCHRFDKKTSRIIAKWAGELL